MTGNKALGAASFGWNDSGRGQGESGSLLWPLPSAAHLCLCPKVSLGSSGVILAPEPPRNVAAAPLSPSDSGRTMVAEPGVTSVMSSVDLLWLLRDLHL